MGWMDIPMNEIIRQPLKTSHGGVFSITKKVLLNRTCHIITFFLKKDMEEYKPKHWQRLFLGHIYAGLLFKLAIITGELEDIFSQSLTFLICKMKSWTRSIQRSPPSLVLNANPEFKYYKHVLWFGSCGTCT